MTRPAIHGGNMMESPYPHLIGRNKPVLEIKP